MLKNIFSVIFIKGFGSLVAFLSSIFIVKVLGPSQSGLYFLVVTIISTLVPFCIIGMTDSIIKYSGANFDHNPNLVAAKLADAIKIVIVISFLISSLLFFLHDHLANILNKPDLGPLIEAASFFLILQALSALLVGLLLGVKKPNMAVFFLNIFPPAIMISLVTCLLIFDASFNTYAVVICYVIGILATCLVLSVKIYRLFMSKQIPILRSFSWKVPNYPLESKSFFLINVTNVLFSSGLFLITGIFLDLTEITALSVCLRFCVVLNIFVAGMNLYAAPYFSNFKSKNKITELRSFAQKISWFLVIFTMPVLFILLFYSNNLLAIFDSSLTEFSWALKILVIAQYAAIIAGPSTYLLMMTGWESEVRNVSLVVVSFCLPLVFLLSWQFGLQGAVASLAISLCMQFIPIMILLRKRLGFFNLSIR